MRGITSLSGSGFALPHLASSVRGSLRGTRTLPDATEGVSPRLKPQQQTLVSHAVRIADEYPSRDAPAYKAAAQTLRQPYWDWASQANLPNAVTLVNITVNGPHGTVTVRNPLNSYRFQRPSVLSGFGGDLAQSLDTVRCGGPRGNNGTRSNEMMEAVAKDLTSYVVRHLAVFMVRCKLMTKSTMCLQGLRGLKTWRLISPRRQVSRIPTTLFTTTRGAVGQLGALTGPASTRCCG